MNTHNSICRIGVFYDGSYYTYARRYFYREREFGWLSFQPLHSLFENFIRTKEQGFSSYKVVYASWHQGLFPPKEATEEQLRFERNHYIDLLHAKIEPKYLPMSQSQGEKGTDVALTVDALQTGQDGKLDIVVLVTGDGDFVPLVSALNKQGIRVVAAYFEHTEAAGRRSYINERLLRSCNYEIDISALEKDREFKNMFKSLFRTPADWNNREPEEQPNLA